jgi:hypothetical protein
VADELDSLETDELDELDVMDELDELDVTDELDSLEELDVIDDDDELEVIEELDDSEESEELDVREELELEDVMEELDVDEPLDELELTLDDEIELELLSSTQMVSLNIHAVGSPVFFFACTSPPIQCPMTKTPMCQRSQALNAGERARVFFLQPLHNSELSNTHHMPNLPPRSM